MRSNIDLGLRPRSILLLTSGHYNFISTSTKVHISIILLNELVILLNELVILVIELVILLNELVILLNELVILLNALELVILLI